MNGHIERHVSIATDRDGTVVAKVTKTVVTVSSDVPTNASVADGGAASAAADMAVGVKDAAAASRGACFDVDALCDAREKAMIEVLRAYLRPQTAPACLIDRLHHCLGDDQSPSSDSRR
ncbi:hypothetical protein [Bifidobacterium simiarum]|uniref:hypothetical protein n=1 Tax=Bifidobacterium simiarum TaxID=2045441 RepID=UPI001BDC7851|nr:hypothetical protein [Bifidobacterium simiarum]MBT1165400.1 hypothetical protein [Bifidobacterium simiarum]